MAVSGSVFGGAPVSFIRIIFLNCLFWYREQEGRRSFSIRNFAEKYSLEIYAGNFFEAEYDDYVPILIAQLHPELAIQF